MVNSSIYLRKRKNDNVDVKYSPKVCDKKNTASDFLSYGVKIEIIFACQILILFVIIFISLYNLTVKHDINEDQRRFYLVLLSASIGYLLSNPAI